MYSRIALVTLLSSTLLACSDDRTGPDLGAPLAILTSELGDAEVGVPYALSFQASGGTSPYTWALADGALPDGLALSDLGGLTGVPTTAGTAMFSVQVTDAANATAKRDLTLEVIGDTMPMPDTTCDAPSALVLMNDSATVNGTLPEVASDDGATACGTDATSAKAYFSLTLAERSDVTIDTTGSVDVALASTVCPAVDGRTTTCGAAIERRLDAGTYLVAVFGAPETEFTMAVAVTPEVIVPDPDGTCDSPIVVDLTGASTMLTGDFADVERDDVSLPCGGVGRPEIVYRLELSERSDIQVSGTSSLLYALLDGACGSSALACDDGFDPLYVTNLAAGSYDLVVEERFDDGRPFQIVVQRLPPTDRPANDRCAMAEVLDLSSGSAQVAGSWIGVVPGSTASCGSQHALYYEVTLDAPSSLQIVDARRNSAIEVRSGCNGAALGCGSFDGLCPSALPAGTYTIRVSPRFAGDFMRDFDLSITREAAVADPTNDTCDSAQAILLAGAQVTVNGSMLRAQSDPVNTMCPNSSFSRDLFYTVDLAERSDVTLRVSGGSSFSYSASLIRGTCANPTGGQCLDRLDQPQTLFGMPAGPLTIALEYDRSISENDCRAVNDAAFSLEISAGASPPPPPNDTCASPTAITFTGGHGSIAAINGTTRGSANDVDPLMCPNQTTRPSGLDVFYEVTVPLASRLRITPTNVQSDMGVSLHSLTCTATSALACSATSGSSSGQGLETQFGVPAGTYFLRVEQTPRFSGQTVTPADFSYVMELLAP